MEPARTRISIVNYTNTLPFKWALRNSTLLQEIDLQEDIPSICAQKLKYGQVDLALIPVAVLPELPEYHIESDYCIGAQDRVDSVKLYSQVPMEQISKVILDYQSRTSVALAKVLLKHHWKKQVEFVEGSPGFEQRVEGQQAAVVIGDRTFRLNGTHKFEWDLAFEWKQLTGLPFVFAAWVSVQKLPETFVERFNKVLAHGLSHIAEAVAERAETDNGYSKQQIEDYLRNKIDYRLDEAKLKALKLFLDYLRR